MNSKEILLNKFRDNKSQQIDASDLRMFVKAIYAETILLENLLDRDDIHRDDQVASLNMVSNLREELNQLKNALGGIEVYNKSETFSKDEVNSIFLTKADSQNNFHIKSEVFNRNESLQNFYTKSEIDYLLSQLK